MSVLNELKPKEVFRYFEEICAIPHGSGNLKAIGDYCERFARTHGLRCVRDECGNVVLFKDGDPGKEPVILQGHLDMVCVKEPGSAHDFLHDPLPIATDGAYVFSRGTTLGGDDGIALAMILAILADDSLHTPPIEAVFTADEETSMLGVLGLDTSVLQGKRMLNLDSETEGAFCVSCAGGARVVIRKAVQTEENTAPCTRVTLTGLAGGHSGTEIHKGHLNAIRTLAGLLIAVTDVRLVSLTGGKVDNAIPDTCSAVFAGDAAFLQKAFDALRPHWQKAEPDIRLGLEPAPQADTCLTAQSTAAVLALIAQVQDGVQEMSREMDNFVQTSLNLGRCTVDAGGAELHHCLRSSVDAELQELIGSLKKRAAKHGAVAEAGDAYPAWQYRVDSPLRELAVEMFQKQYGKKPAVEAIHAGLECGIFAGKIPGLDCISMGPDILDIHSPQERLSVASTERTYRLVCSILENM